MDKLKAKEAEIDRAIAGINQASATVKRLSSEVEKGITPRSQLFAAIKDLKNKEEALKILNAEAKVFSGYKIVTFNEIAPKVKKNNFLWALVCLIALWYLVRY